MNEDLRERTKAFALRVIKLYSALRKPDPVAQILGKQVLRSGTSVGANYREAYRARSGVEFVSKLADCLKELEETSYWRGVHAASSSAGLKRQETANTPAEITSNRPEGSPPFRYPSLTEFLGPPHPVVEKVTSSAHTVWLDKAQTTGFRGVREDVWNFHIGGYQVCEKWLKDRKGRPLTADDLDHYQKIVIALSETIRLMAAIDTLIKTHGGWPLK